ncbi:hypothetical protein [Methanosarcina acetivorans]|nr:hypothetical protein [Methanosarcina acetivorans]
MDEKEQKMRHGLYIKTDANFNHMLAEILREDREILIALGRC